jgi:hypothetical protein
MMVSLNGVIQAPNTSYSVSGSTITFLPSSGTLSSSDSIDFIMVYGNILDLGVASSVTDSSITKGKLNLISDSSSAGLTVKGDGSSENGTIALNCSSNSHAVKLSSPSHASGQSYEMILPATNITAGKFLKVDSVSGSGATGIGQLSFADAGGGKVLQVVMGTQTSMMSYGSTSFADTTLTATITPASSSNKVLVLVSQIGTVIQSTTSTRSTYFNLVRGSTQLFQNYSQTKPDSSTTRYFVTNSMNYLDSPNTSSATTYKTQVRGDGGSWDIYLQKDNLSQSQIILIEVSA